MAELQLNIKTREERLEDRRQAKINDLNNACSGAIRSGFTSNALGTEHFYPTEKLEDQVNLIANRTGQQMCRDPDGAWAYRAHTAAQMEQVLADGSAQKLAHLQKVNALREQAQAATSEAELEAVAW